MFNLKAKLQKQLLTSKNNVKNIRTKEPIWIDLQAENDLVLIYQQSHPFRGTSNPSNKNINSNAPQNQYFHQTFWKADKKQEKRLVYKKGQFTYQTIPAIRNPRVTYIDLEEEQEIVEKQKKQCVLPPQQPFSCQPGGVELKRKLAEKLDNSKNRKNQLNFHLSSTNKDSFMDVEPEQETFRKLSSRQNFEPIVKKVAQVKQTQPLKRKERSYSRKQRKVFSSQIQDSTTFSDPSRELLEVALYRFKIPQVARKISNIFEEVKRDPKFKMSRAKQSMPRQSRALVEQSPRYLIGSRQYQLKKKKCRIQMERRRFMQIE